MSGNHNMYCSGNQPDIVEILRENADLDAAEHVPDDVVKMQYEAADEIEGLRSALSNAGLIIDSLHQQLAECEEMRKDMSEDMQSLYKDYFAVTKERDELKSLQLDLQMALQQLATVTKERDELKKALQMERVEPIKSPYHIRYRSRQLREELK